nr:hypothetical protein [Fodinicola feengrottensis]
MTNGDYRADAASSATSACQFTAIPASARHVDIDRVLLLDGEPVAVVEPTSSTALQDIQADRRTVSVGSLQQRTQDSRAESPTLKARFKIKMFQQQPALHWSQGDTARERIVGQDDRRVLRGERIPQPLPYAMFVETTQSFQIRSHYHGP